MAQPINPDAGVEYLTTTTFRCDLAYNVVRVEDGARMFLTRWGRVVAAVVPAKDLAWLLELERLLEREQLKK